MKIQYASDLHLEMAANRRYMQNIPFEAMGDVLVRAGDIGYLCDKTMSCPKFWEWASADLFSCVNSAALCNDRTIATNTLAPLNIST